MNKLRLIFQREYLSRVTKRTFILATLLTPLGFALLFFVGGYLQTYDEVKNYNFTVIDESGILEDSLVNNKGYTFNFSKKSLAEELAQFDKSKNFAIIHLPKEVDLKSIKLPLQMYSDEKINMSVRMGIEKMFEKQVRNHKIKQSGIKDDDIAALETAINIDTKPIKSNGKEETSLGATITSALGFILGFVMYMCIFLYGMMVMRSVMEEKTNRIVEVMISSVKPFELMMGKILGVAAVGLTQLLIWCTFGVGIAVLGTMFFGVDAMQANQLANNPEMVEAMAKTDVQKIIAEVSNINWWYILSIFAFYFVLGYILYASLFAAVGASIGDDTGEAQSLTLPISIPIILAIYIMTHAIRQPDSNISVFASIFPLFSPIVMPARLGFHPPVWQLALSMVLLIATVILFVWIAGRIYRVGILLYGKKVNFIEMIKLIFQRG